MGCGVADAHTWGSPELPYVSSASPGPTNSSTPGYAITLEAHTTTKRRIAAEAVGEAGAVAEEVGALAARRLVEEIRRGGSVDTAQQPLVVMLMSVCVDVSRAKFGPLSAEAVECLRTVKEVLGVVFGMREEEGTGAVVATCAGAGVRNVARGRS